VGATFSSWQTNLKNLLEWGLGEPEAVSVGLKLDRQVCLQGSATLFL
jgi:hypothetical protein